MAARVKYQVFISSTYQDLKDARLEVLKAILRNDQIPAGMEAFPATNDRGWEIIRRTIDESDYYVLLLGGQYGSYRRGESGPSWTEYEYDYARKRGLPVLAFMRDRARTPGNLIETDPDKAKCLRDFITRVRSQVPEVGSQAGSTGEAGLDEASKSKESKKGKRVGKTSGRSGAKKKAAEKESKVDESGASADEKAEKAEA